MKKKLLMEASLAPLATTAWPRLLVLGLVAALGSSPQAWAQTPQILGTSLVDGSNYRTYGLNLVGGFKQVRLQATTGAAATTVLWEFALGASNFSTNWRPYNPNLTLAGFNQFIDPTQQVASARLNNNGGGSTGRLPATNSGSYYTFNIPNTTSNQSIGNSMEVLETTFNPVSINAPTATAPAFGQATAVTATLGGAPDAAENFFLRYSSDSYATSTVQLMTKSGTTVTGTIPGQVGNSVSYYIFSSNKTATQLAGDLAAVNLQVVYDMATLNLSTGATYSAAAPLNGTYTVNQNVSSTTNFTSIGAAFAALTANGVSGPVQFNVKDNQTFTENNLALVAISGASATSRITFQRDNSGSGAPLVQASTNLSPGQQDAVIKLQGADFITFNGINVSENISNNSLGAGNNEAMEYGYALFRASATDGCQNNVIRNCAITLNRNNGNPTYGIWLANTNLGGNVVDAASTEGTNSNNTLTGNTIGNCFYGIDAAGQGLNDTGNTLGGDPASAVAGNTISVIARFGILAYNQSSLVVGGNTVSFAPGNTGLMYGIVIGANTAGTLVAGNRVRTLKYTGSSGVGVRGISLDPGNVTATITVRNNAVSDLTADGNGATLANQIMGIGVLSGAGYSIYNNSVQLDGERAANAFNKVSAALFVANGATGLDVRNNVLSNIQTVAVAAGLPGTNYAVYAEAASSPFTLIDYNLYDLRSGSTSRTTAVSPQFLGHLNGVDYATLAAWQVATGQDRSSMLSSGSNTAGFSDAINLTPDTNLPSAYVLNGTGVQIGSVTTDINGTPRSTTVAAGAPDLGAYEFTPSTTPNPLDVSGPPTLGGTQTFSLNGRPLAVITYGTTGTVPTNVVARYYPGTNPPTPFATGARYQNAYFVFGDVANNGSGYTYTLTTYYDPALLGTIASESAQRLQLRRADASGYDPIATTVNTTARTLTSPATLTRFDLVAIDDMAAPLPVELTAFAAQRQGTEAVLSWITARETNNAGYEVQVSLSGSPQDFRPLGFVTPALATSATAHSYTFRDAETGKTGLRYYRLRQVDLDGRSTFSPVRTVQFDALAAASLAATPNPFSGSLTLHLELPQASAAATLTLTDALGRVVLHQDLGALPAGISQAIMQEASALPAGVYVARLVLATGTHLTKVVKE